MNVREACLYERLGWTVPIVCLCLVWTLKGDAATPPVATGASVDESRVQNVYHVDVASADAANDDKHGTADAPFATINYACEAAARDQDKNIGSKVVIAPGVYRETVEIRPPAAGGANTDAPLIVESAERGQAVIDGADTEGWTASTWKSDGAQWTHPWPFRRNPAQLAAWARGLHAFGRAAECLGGGLPSRRSRARRWQRHAAGEPAGGSRAGMLSGIRPRNRQPLPAARRTARSSFCNRRRTRRWRRPSSRSACARMVS